jgi:hypothetical protein
MFPAFESVAKSIKDGVGWSIIKKKRFYYLIKRILIWMGALGIIAFGLYVFAISPGDDSDLLFYLGLGIMILPLLFVRKLDNLNFRDYSWWYKEFVIYTILDEISRNSNYPDEPGSNKKSRYQQYGYIKEKLLNRSPLFANLAYNYLTGEDHFIGKLGYTDFECAEMEVINVSLDSNNKLHRKLKYKGFVFIADFHKTFEGTTVVRTRKGKTYGSIMPFIGSSIQTESYEFDKMFDVFTTDEVTARYLLPSNIMERLMKLRQQFSKYGITISLHDGIIAILIHKSNFFEADRTGRLNDKTLKKTYDEITSILGIIDLLKLNTRIWSKQQNVLKTPKNANRTQEHEPKAKKRKAKH